MGKRLFFSRAMLPSYDEYISEVKDIWDNHWVTSFGPKQQKFEEKLKEKLKANNVVTVSSGHIALELTLQALELKGEVITTPYTFISTTHAIVRNGLTPVFCDITEFDYNINADLIESLITEKTSAIVAVHTYGNLCDVEKINTLAKRYNLKVVYDAAHAFGVERGKQSIANCGDATTYSFHASKVFNSIEGGAVVCSNKALANKIRMLSNFGIESETEIPQIGINGKMHEFEAAMGLCNLKNLECEVLRRKILYEEYKVKLDNIEKIRCGIIEEENLKNNYIYFPILFQTKDIREKVFKRFRDIGVVVCKHFYPLTPDYACYKDIEFVRVTPVADTVSERILLFPLHTGIEVTEIISITEKVKAILEKE